MTTELQKGQLITCAHIDIDETCLACVVWDGDNDNTVRVREVLPNGDVVVKWKSGEAATLYRDRRDEWSFYEGNTEYRAGYAYACGYHD